MPVFNGTPSADVIDGSVDPDEIHGDEGDDQLYGHESGDEIYGDEGDDLLAGGQGEDTLEGGTGNDTLHGSTDNDTLNGQDGDDLLMGEEGDDVINGGDGNDTIGNDDEVGNHVTNGSFEDGTHSANSVNGLTGWFNTTGSPDSADDGAAAEGWNPGNFASEGTGYVSMWAVTNGTQESMQQTLGTQLDAGTTYTVSFDAFSADYVGGQWFTPTDIPVTFEIIDQSTSTVLGTVTVQSTEYESYDFTITPTSDVTDIVIRPVGAGQGTYPSIVMDDLVIVEGTGPFGEPGDDTIDGGAGDDLIYTGDGDDEIIGGDGADEIYGQSGDDRIYADEADSGPDLIFGGGGADTIHADGNDTVDGGAGGIDADVLNLSGTMPPGGTRTVVITGTDSNGNGSDGYVEYRDADGNLISTLEFSEIETIIECFTPGTLIKTTDGDVPVEQLQLGEKVLTKDNGYQHLQWIGRKSLDATDLVINPDLRPIRISQGALGNDLPQRDMLVSPQHRMLLNKPKAALWFGQSEVLVAAKYLTVLDGIDRSDVEQVSYIHIMCSAHEIVLADGAWSESFQPGDMSLVGLDNDIRGELLALFPEMDVDHIKRNYRAARRSLKRFEARVLLS